MKTRPNPTQALETALKMFLQEYEVAKLAGQDAKYQRAILADACEVAQLIGSIENGLHHKRYTSIPTESMLEICLGPLMDNTICSIKIGSKEFDQWAVNQLVKETIEQKFKDHLDLAGFVHQQFPGFIMTMEQSIVLYGHIMRYIKRGPMEGL